jgi:acyl-homoserine-lactone acylase
MAAVCSVTTMDPSSLTRQSWRRAWSWCVAGLCLTGIALVVPLTALVPVAGAAAPPSGSGHYTAEIRRTEYGIPHILATDFGSLGYGFGYAFAQDDLCAMASHVLTLRGQRSRYFGPDAATGDPLEPVSNLTSDIYHQAVLQSGVVQRLLSLPPPLGPTPQARQLVEGYVAGYNRYLADTGVAHLPDPTCRGAAWAGPITALDVWSGVYDLNRYQGADQFMTSIATASPPAASGRAGRGEAGPAQPAQPGGSAGSNAIALGRDATHGQDGMLLANPHFPWIGPGRFYQAQLTIPGVLDVSGASPYGWPVIWIGHTATLAWTHTVSTARRYTLYRLTLVPGDPARYLVDGKPEPMTRQAVTVTVKNAAGGLSAVTRTLYGSRYGPVLANGWTTTAAYAIRDVNTGNLRSLSEWLAIDQAGSIPQLRAAEDTYQGLPFMNTIAADSRGTAYYADASVVPHVTDQQAARCAVPGKNNRFLDGSRSACQWGNDPDAIQPGIFGPGHDPQLARTDYVTNSNDSPWLTNPAAPLTGYPQAYGDTGTARSLRTRLGLSMVTRRLAGTDGLGPPGFTLPALQATTLGDRDYSAELGRADVLAMCRAHPVLTASNGQPVQVGPACTVLARWDSRGDPGSRGEVLWRQFIDQTDGTWWRIPFDPAQPLTTPSGIDTSLPAVQQAFADTVQYFQHNRIPLDIPVGAAQRYAAIPIPGCDDDPEGCFNVIMTTGPLNPDGTYPPIYGGSSFIMAVELTAHGPIARTILTYSESANPASPHYRDQTLLFSRKQWVTERFTETEIDTDPQLSITTLRN